jgi:hypothetical protein
MTLLTLRRCELMTLGLRAPHVSIAWLRAAVLAAARLSGHVTFCGLVVCG